MMRTSSQGGTVSIGTTDEVGLARRLLHALSGPFAMLLIALAVVAALSPADAQVRKEKSLSGVFGGFAGDTNAPIDIEADRLVVSDNKKMAVFTGNVKAVQGDFTLRTPRLEVYYSSGSPTAGKSASGGEITRLKALQKVRVTSGPDQSATGDEAVFDVKAQTVVLTGKVVVKQGKNIITGERLFIDLKTNTTRLDPGRGGGAKPGRVKMIIHRDAVKKVSKKPVSKLGVRPAKEPGTSGWSSKTQPRN
jgi:lipopolysaccharide export system protein LptA